MPKSMTGYGRFEYVSEQRKITAEVKSVNHRYSDITVKIPRMYIYLEDYLRNLLLENISRGKADIYVTVEEFGDTGKTVKVDEAVLEQYYGALRLISEKLGLKQEITPVEIAKFPDVLVIEKQEEDKEITKQQVGEAVSGAIKEFVRAREREGGRISEFLNQRIEYILSIVNIIEEKMPESVELYRLRLTEKVKELLGDGAVDESRILTETAVFADKICTDEEIVRLKSHIAELSGLLKLDAPVGRRMDFIIQEMNREINTVGSKTNDIEVTKLVVEVKSEIEKLREQVQNIE